MALLLGVALHATSVHAGQPAECGDVDGDGEVGATDPLMVLRKSAGSSMPYPVE